MSWSDTLKSAVGNLVGQAEQQAVPEMIKTALGAEGLQALVAKLRDAGLGNEVASWLDNTRNNLPITPEQIRNALGDAHVQQLARSLGIPVDTILSALADYLPQAVGAGTPAAPPPSP